MRVKLSSVFSLIYFSCSLITAFVGIPSIESILDIFAKHTNPEILFPLNEVVPQPRLDQTSLAAVYTQYVVVYLD